MALHVSQPFRQRLDRLGVFISALCVVHCVSGLVLVTFLGIGGTLLLDPRVHEYGLAIAVVVGALGLGFGALRHRRMGLVALGGTGLALMALGLVVPHGLPEAIATIIGVTLVATAHIRNLRHHA
ncbi:MAG TPA: MerC domain-containing protein [Novosphingobium sp.]|nr:MerC domain-containing protein [Novosphingobium sp.]